MAAEPFKQHHNVDSRVAALAAATLQISLNGLPLIADVTLWAARLFLD